MQKDLSLVVLWHTVLQSKSVFYPHYLMWLCFFPFSPVNETAKNGLWSPPTTSLASFLAVPPQWGAADAKIKVPSGENTDLKRCPFKAWSRSVYSQTCYAYCQGFLPYFFLPFQSIHLHFFQNLSQFFPVLACRIKYVTLLDAGSSVEGPRSINRKKKQQPTMTCGMMTCEMNNLEIEWSLCSALM